MSDFAKLFQVEGIGQILVMQDTDDDGNPAVKIHFQPPELGVCCMCLSFKDTDDGWEKCDKAFANMDEEAASEAVRTQLAMLEQSGALRLTT